MAQLAQVFVAGSPRERGRSYGETLRGLIRARDAAWKDDIAKSCKIPAKRFLAAFLEDTSFLPAIRQHAPDLLEEVEAIAEGANLAFADVLAAQLMDEQWWYAEAFKRRHHCSSLGSLDRKTGTALIAQTMDLPGWMDGFQTALVIAGPRDAGTTTVLTVAGMIGLCGMVRRKDGGMLGLCVNTLAQLASNPCGLPVAFVSRMVLAASDFAAARSFLERVPHASGQNYILSDGRDLIDLECSAGGALAMANGARSDGLVWHANHPIASSDRRRTPAGRKVMATGASSCHRMAALDAMLASHDKPLDAHTVKALLADRSDRRFPISRPRKNGTDSFTFAGVVWDLGAEPRAEIAPGPPCSATFECIAPGAGQVATIAAAE